MYGINCRYDGKNAFHPQIAELAKTNVVVPVCPEQPGGLSTPRSPADIQGGNGEDVLSAQSRILIMTGEDVTDQFIIGAPETLKIAKLTNPVCCILRSAAPPVEWILFTMVHNYFQAVA